MFIPDLTFNNCDTTCGLASYISTLAFNSGNFTTQWNSQYVADFDVGFFRRWLSVNLHVIYNYFLRYRTYPQVFLNTPFA